METVAPHTHTDTHFQIGKTLISIFTISSCSLYLPLARAHTSTVHGREGKAVAFQVRYFPLTRAADQAEPVMDGKRTAADRYEGGVAVRTRWRNT